ncbi:MAG: hypothetical protein WC657_08190 [Candidatus Paceibacterota bacterium]|jgi:hypothetical protein
MSENQEPRNAGKVELTYTINSSSIQSTQVHLRQANWRPMCADIYHYVPEADIEFIVGGVIMFLPYLTLKIPLVDFALRLRKLVNTLKVNETLSHGPILTGNLNSFTLNDDETVTVKSLLGLKGHCTLADLQVVTDQFCLKVYEDIVRLFPDYFTFMDTLLPGKVRTDISPSERIISELLGRQ